MCGRTKLWGLTGGGGGGGGERVERMLQECDIEFGGEGGSYRGNAWSCHCTLLI